MPLLGWNTLLLHSSKFQHLVIVILEASNHMPSTRSSLETNEGHFWAALSYDCRWRAVLLCFNCWLFKYQKTQEWGCLDLGHRVWQWRIVMLTWWCRVSSPLMREILPTEVLDMYSVFRSANGFNTHLGYGNCTALQRSMLKQQT